MQSARIAVARLRRRDPAAVDRAVAILLLAAVWLQVALDGSIHHPLLTGIAGSVAAVAVATRRRWPLGSLVVSLGVTLAAEAVGGPGTSSATATIVSTVLLAYGAGAFLAMPRAAVALGVGVAGLALNVAITTGASDDLFFDLVVVGLMPWAVGRMLRARATREQADRELAERLDAERELLARESALAERARIARELHDVIAHSVSVMVIQAGGARTVMDTEPDRAEASLFQVERAGREALAELRRLVGSLHPAEAASLAPPPRLADIDDLIARTRAAGLETRPARRGRCSRDPRRARSVRLPDRAGVVDQRHQARRPRPGSASACAGSATRSSWRSPTTAVGLNAVTGRRVTASTA